MRVLALDTTTRDGSVASWTASTSSSRSAAILSRSHGERLPRDLVAALARVDLTVEQVDLFAVASGPGSFTGLRIGIATMQGLALVSRRRIAPISALEAIAQAASRGLASGSLVAAWMDAHRREVFSASTKWPMRRLHVRATAGTRPASRRCAQHPCRPLAARGTGRGCVRRRRRGSGTRPPGHGAGRARPALAGVIGRMAVDRARAGATVNPAGVQPLYVRRPDAELARRRRRRAARHDGLANRSVAVTLDEIDNVLAVEEASFRTRGRGDCTSPS